MQVHQIFNRSTLCLALLGLLTVTAASVRADTLDDVVVATAAGTSPAPAPGAAAHSGAVGTEAATSDGPVSDAPGADTKTFGAAVATEGLEDQRGGTDLGAPVPLNGILASGNVSDNRAINVVTGSNSIRDGAFNNTSGIPVVIQNTGANVLIQSATIVNVQLK
jgi:hypothetical protein